MDDKPADPQQRPRRGRSLLARALGHLARREHSRVELARKLAPHAESAEQLDAVLADLEGKKLLSEARFVEVLARTRGERFGAARVKQELKAHRIGDEVLRATVDALRKSELERAQALWHRRFGTVAIDGADRLRQMRFLAGRGFSADVIRRVVKGAELED